jgi:predicted nucleotidyltransferase
MHRSDRIREEIAQEAARLMFEEDVKEYRDAKRKAARRFGEPKAVALGSHLPSNAEIHAELVRLIARHEGGVLPERVLQLRLLALKHLELFAPFSPLLVGSVLKGAVRAASDVDLHLFADDPEEVETFLAERAIPYNRETVCVRHGNRFIDYPHIYLEDQGTVIECSVYPPEERRHPAKSSITGKAMERVDAKGLARLIAATLDKERSGG